MPRIDTRTTAIFDYAYFDLTSDELIIESFLSTATDYDDEFFKIVRDDDLEQLFMNFNVLEALKITIEQHTPLNNSHEVSKDVHRKFLSLRDKFAEAINMIDSLKVSDE